MIKFNATIEFLSAQLAVVELHSVSGEWAGSYRVDYKGRFDLFELGYIRASQEASLKGGTLDRFSEHTDPERCGSRIEPAMERRRANALNVEIGSPLPRCTRKSPDGRGLVWLLSGGSPLSYGHCTPNACPVI